MKKSPDPQLALTFWPHLLVQALAFTSYETVFRELGLCPSLALRIDVLKETAGLAIPILLWTVYVFLFTELVLRHAHKLAFVAFPSKFSRYQIFSSILSLPALFLIYVLFECLLFLFVNSSFPLDFGQVSFLKGLFLTMIADWPFLIVLLTGELLRHLLLSQIIHDYWKLLHNRASAPSAREIDG